VNAPPRRKVRVLVVDDSVLNRRAITTRLQATGEVDVVARAADGAEALKLAHDLRPDVITLDLEMPKMDGFSFLRLLMASRPTPVIIVSSYSQKENVFRALELGAVDFVAKPDAGGVDAVEVLDGLCQKVLGFGAERAVNVRPSVLPAAPQPRGTAPTESRLPPRWLVGIVASTGGPSALSELFARLNARGSYAIVLAQHMPERFTRTFAERLDRKSTLRVSEAIDGDLITGHTGFVCPGRQCMEVHAQPGGQLRIKLMPQAPEDRYAPSGNRLLTSVAAAAKTRAIGVILTGMGDDGTEGARAIIDNGGIVIAESEDTAVIYGMPGSAVRAGVVTRSLPLSQIADQLDELIR
jgi:two-component system chemotaxis response regulator CheB